MKVKLLAFIAMIFIGLSAGAQKAALKTNIFYDATATLNGGVEVKFAPNGPAT